MKGSECSWVKETNKYLQMMIYLVLHAIGELGLPMMNRNAANMKNIQLIHIHRLKLMDKYPNRKPL